jgi:N-acetylmuramoyl-L-alanine amidase
MRRASHRRRFSLLFLIAAAPQAGGTAEIVAVRHWSAPDHTRIVIDLTGPAEFAARVLEGPDRIALDLPGTRFAPGVEAFPVDDGIVRQVRLNRLEGPKAQIVLDLVGPRRHGVFALKPHADKPDRIVIDVFRPAAAQDPDELAAPKDDGVQVVVIDPGHGGEDPGAIGLRGIKEKTICFEVATKLRRELEKRSGLRVILTRSGDYYIPLRQRYRVAEDNDADLFVSVHANSAKSRSASGAEVFFLTLGPATDAQSRRIAELENAADLVGGAPPEAGDHLIDIIADLRMKDTLTRSSLVAESLIGALDRHDLMATRSVKQARFVVLQSPQVPSALVEIGFLSNPSDAKLITRRDFSDRVARSLAEGITLYLRRVVAARE